MADEQDAAAQTARAARAARTAEAAEAAKALQPPMPGRRRERRRVKGAATLAVLMLAVIGFAGYEFAANAGHARHPAAAAVRRPTPTFTSTTTPTASPVTASTPPASQSPAASASPSSSPRVLVPASVVAFGPSGTADGENPNYASLAVSGHTATPWYSYVSTSPDLPGPVSGTGLLLDLGRTVTVTSVQVSGNGDGGASVALRAGSKPLLSGLPEVASVSGAGNTMLLQPRTPVPARYVLIWFTQLPLDLTGTYQASVYQVTVQGQP